MRSACCAAAAVATARPVRLAYAPMPAGDYLEGLVLFGRCWAASSPGAWLLHAAAPRSSAGLDPGDRVRPDHDARGARGPPRCRGSSDSSGRGSVLVATALWVAVAALVPARRRRAIPPRSSRARRSRLGDPRLALLSAGSPRSRSRSLLDQAALAPGSIDILNFHLPGVARWIENGSIWQVDNFLPIVAPGNYPNNGDVILLAAVLPVAQRLPLAPVDLPVLGAHRRCRSTRLRAELGARRVRRGARRLPACSRSRPSRSRRWSTAFSTRSCCSASPPGSLFLLRHQPHAGRRRSWSSPASALGVAFGTKWYGVSSVAIVVFVGLWRRLGSTAARLAHGARARARRSSA